MSRNVYKKSSRVVENILMQYRRNEYTYVSYKIYILQLKNIEIMKQSI